jgi:molybdate-binding protein
MKKTVVDLMTYRIEKTLRENGFIVKRDEHKNIKILIKLKSSD